MKCPVCSEAELVHDARDAPYIYKSKTTILAGVTGEFCPACNESVLDANESRRVSDLMLDFNKEVKTAHL